LTVEELRYKPQDQGSSPEAASIFQCTLSFQAVMALGLTQSRTEGKWQPERKTDNLTVICEPTV
jgi:hypothetical protein